MTRALSLFPSTPHAARRARPSPSSLLRPDRSRTRVGIPPHRSRTRRKPSSEEPPHCNPLRGGSRVPKEESQKEVRSPSSSLSRSSTEDLPPILLLLLTNARGPLSFLAASSRRDTRRHRQLLPAASGSTLSAPSSTYFRFRQPLLKSSSILSDSWERNMKRSDSDSGAQPRKLKFAPKIPVRKQQKPAVIKTESSGIKDDFVDKKLLAKLNSAKSQDGFGRRLMIEKKVEPAQVTFGYGNTSTKARSFGSLKGSTETRSEECSGQVSPPKEYVEPWDYIRSHYPVTLPLRRPYSGDPEVLDALEFGEGGTAHLPINESQINAAKELGFMESSEEPKMIFLQFPTRLPLLKPPNEEKAPVSKTTSSSSVCKLKDLPAGFMGKLLVYKSGKVKMKLGDVLFDVSPGANHIFAEQVVAVNPKEKQFCVLGELSKHAVVTPDVDSMLDALDDPVA